MIPRFHIENLDTIKAKQLKPSISKNPFLSSQDLQDELENNLIVKSLVSENEALKQSLNSEIKKKDDLLNVLLKYIDTLETAEKKTLHLESKVQQIESIKNEIEHVKQELIKKDEIIQSLHSRNKSLEQSLEKNAKKPPLLNKINNTQVLNISLEVLLQKIQSNPSFSKIFKNTSPDTSLSIKSLEKLKIEETCLKLSKFAYELMMEMENFNFRISSPGFSDYQPEKKRTLSNDYIQSPEKERFESLNKEISDIISSSKQVLQGNSLSACPSASQLNKFSPTVSSNNSDTNIKQKSNPAKESTYRVQPKTVKSSRCIPKVEIIQKPLKLIQKSLKK